MSYIRDNLFAALKIPKAYKGYEKDLTGKATLAAEDIRFARTIERIQRIILSELTKIALVHLYVQGYEGESLTNFELSLTTPSIIYDQERIALMKEKVDLAGQILTNNLLPTDWIYDNIFHLSEDQYSEYRDLIAEDKKRKFRFDQIENEGNDPQETGESYGTPHDLATLYGASRYPGTGGVPDGYDEKELGRPKEKSSIYNTQQDPLGKDRSGAKGMKDNETEVPFKTAHKNGSPLAFESMTKNTYMQHRGSLTSLSKKKKMIFENNKPGLLDESNIKDI